MNIQISVNIFMLTWEATVMKYPGRTFWIQIFSKSKQNLMKQCGLLEGFDNISSKTIPRIKYVTLLRSSIARFFGNVLSNVEAITCQLLQNWYQCLELRAAFSNKLATNRIWLYKFKFKFVKIKNLFFQ